MSLTFDTNPAETELTFYCKPTLRDVVDRGTVMMEVTWFQDSKVIHKEEFDLETRRAGILTQDKWSIGGNVSSRENRYKGG